jgi:hypothetical protein
VEDDLAGIGQTRRLCSAAPFRAPAYPQFVSGEGYGAEIQLNQEQLDKAISSSVLLVKHAAERLRAAQLQRVRLISFPRLDVT